VVVPKVAFDLAAAWVRCHQSRTATLVVLAARKDRAANLVEAANLLGVWANRAAG